MRNGWNRKVAIRVITHGVYLLKLLSHPWYLSMLISMQLACSVQIPQIFGGLQGECIYLDTEGSLSLSRLKEIANAFLEKMSSVAQEKNNPVRIFAFVLLILSNESCFVPLGNDKQLW